MRWFPVLGPAGLALDMIEDSRRRDERRRKEEEDRRRAQVGSRNHRKDGGDHQFDVTHGTEIVASASRSDEMELAIGKGIGVIGNAGLCAPPGKPAISQSARQQILEAIAEGLRETGLKGARVELSVPCGEDLAAKTLNPKLGVMGGISILGSTGFVEPWNEHLGESRSGEIKGLKKVVVTTGRTGLKFSRILFPDHKAVLIGSQLDLLEFEEDQESVLCGLPALILKWSWPQVLEGTGCGTVAELVERMPKGGWGRRRRFPGWRAPGRISPTA